MHGVTVNGNICVKQQPCFRMISGGGNLHQWSRGGRLKLVVWFRGHCQSVWIETRSASPW